MKNIRLHKGFTMVELVIVLAILGILGAAAVVMMNGVTNNASKSSLDTLATSLQSAASSNYSGCVATKQVPTAGQCVKISTCADIGKLLASTANQSGGVAITSTAQTADDVPWMSGNVNLTNGVQTACTLSVIHGGQTNTNSFQGIGAGN